MSPSVLFDDHAQMQAKTALMALAALTPAQMAPFAIYAERLVAYNELHNLIAPSTVPLLWSRHFLDSAQLWPIIAPWVGGKAEAPDTTLFHGEQSGMSPAASSASLLPVSRETYTATHPLQLLDIGSGAGFPGLVLAIIAQQQGVPLHLTLAESVGKKAVFLQQIATELALPVTVYANRAEALTHRYMLVTARAVAPLPKLLPLIAPRLAKGSAILLLKGAQAQNELTAAATTWHFSVKAQPSVTEPTAQLLVLQGLRRQAPAGERKKKHVQEKKFARKRRRQTSG